MKRELKFRAWDLDRERLSEPFKLADRNVYFNKGRRDMSMESLWVWPDDYQVMQFTGLKDRNGVEIYEGDVLGTKGEKALPSGARVIGSYSFEHGTKDAVEWERDGWSVGTKDLAEWLWGAERYSNGEVVGNIYENPELAETSTASVTAN